MNSIAIQLWTVREALEHSFDDTLVQLKRIGYPAVETAGFYGLAPATLRAKLANAGLTLCSTHRALPERGEAEAAFVELAELGAPAVFPSMEPECFSDDIAIGKSAERFNAMVSVATQHDVELGYHNHWWEFAKLPDGTTAYERFLERLDPAVTVEVDTYWAQAGGVDAVDLVRSLGDRVHFLHVKDGPIDKEDDQTAVGDGKMDVDAILTANASVRWNIVELDAFSGDIWEAVRRSYDYLSVRLL